MSIDQVIREMREAFNKIKQEGGDSVLISGLEQYLSVVEAQSPQSVNSPRRITNHDLLNLSLSATTRVVMKALTSFSGWLMIGFGSAFSLLFANLDAVLKFVPLSSFRWGVIFLLASLALGIVCRVFGAQIQAANETTGEIEKALKNVDVSLINLAQYSEQFQNTLFFWNRWLARKAMAKAAAGDYSIGARMLARMSQIYALLVISQGALAICACGSILFGVYSHV